MIRPNAGHLWPGAAVVLAVLIGLTSCSTAPAPREELAAADLAVREAEEAEAGTYAPAPLRRARDKLEQAKIALSEGEHAQARQLAEQALVDAQLAQAQARSEVARQNLQEMHRSIEDLRTETMSRS